MISADHAGAEGHSNAEEDEQILEELEADDEDRRPLSEAEIVEKYDTGQSRIIIQRNDFLVPNILQMVADRDILEIAPQYQRRYRWNNKKKSQLIESLLINIPIPPIFLYEREYAKYEVMDGQQRLTTVRSFFNNEFKLTSLSKWRELNGRTFRDLPQRIQAGLERRSLAAVIVLTESGATPEAAMELRQYVFERLNTGGQPLNAHEVRNCIYASNFNDLLVSLARSALFTAAWDIPPKEPDEPQHISAKLARNNLYSSMYDCEIVLRYFALSDMSNFVGGMKRTLDKYMARMVKATKHECQALGREYLEVLGMAHELYGQALFRLPASDRTLSGRRSVPFSDALLLAMRVHRHRRTSLASSRSRIIAETVSLFDDSEIYEALVGRANTREAINRRIEIMTQFVGRYAG